MIERQLLRKIDSVSLSQRSREAPQFHLWLKWWDNMHWAQDYRKSNQGWMLIIHRQRWDSRTSLDTCILSQSLKSPTLIQLMRAVRTFQGFRRLILGSPKLNSWCPVLSALLARIEENLSQMPLMLAPGLAKLLQESLEIYSKMIDHSSIKNQDSVGEYIPNWTIGMDRIHLN